MCCKRIKNPTSWFDLFQSGLTAEADGNGAGATAFYKRALELAPEQGEVHLNLGIVQQALDRQTEAESSLTSAFKFLMRAG